MMKVTLGNTGVMVSRLGLGAVKFGRNEGVHYPTSFSLPSDYEIESLLDCAKSLGINLIDTAPAYGVSEERLGKLLKNNSEWIVSTKVGEEFINGKSFFDFSEEALERSITRSLKRLNRDFLDIVLVHSNGEDKKIIETNTVFETLGRLKKSGLLRAFGISTKTVEGGLLAIEQSDVAMVTYNPLQNEDKTVIDLASKKNKGIFIKKALASGHLQKIDDDDPVQVAMNFIFQTKGVSSVIVGTLNQKHLIHDVNCAKRAWSKK